MQKYVRGDCCIPSPGEEGPAETTDAMPVGSRKNRATDYCAEEV
jgi:hypothetical protein